MPGTQTQASKLAPSHNKATAKDFLTGSDPNAEKFTFQFVRGSRARTGQMSFAKAWRFVEKLNTPASGYNVFVRLGNGAANDDEQIFKLDPFTNWSWVRLPGTLALNGPTKPRELDGGKSEQAGENQAAQQPNTASPKATALEPFFEGVPSELRLKPNWILWRYEPPDRPDNPKWKKVPCRVDGKRTDAAARTPYWTTFDACQNAYLRGVTGKGPRFDGIGFCFDGEIGSDGYCYTGVDFDNCCDGNTVVLKQKARINRLATYTEQSPSGRGFHCICRSKPHTLKTGDVEIYSRARFFTFTGHGVRDIRAADAELQAIAAEVLAEQKTSAPEADTAALTMAGAFAHLDPNENLGAGVEQWFDLLTGEQKDEAVDHALAVIASKTTCLELEENGGNNDQWYRLTTAIARSGAPNAEAIFVEYAAKAKDADPEDKLRDYFARCQKEHPRGRGVTVGTLIHLAQEHGADFEPWRRLVPRKTQPLPAHKLFQSSAEFVADFVPPDYLIDGLLQRRYVYSFTAKTGDGKTAIALLLAAYVAKGTPLAGCEVEKGRVLFFAGENPDDVRTRWIMLCEVLNEDPDQMDVVFMPFTPNLSAEAIRARIDAEAAKAGPFSLLIVDTSASYYSGNDENDNVALGNHARMLRTFVNLPGGPTILVTCHPTKNPDMANLLPRGGGAFLAEVDGNLVAIKDPNTMTVEVTTHGKFRGPDFALGGRPFSREDLSSVIDGRG
jgi:hypothetical protein